MGHPSTRRRNSMIPCHLLYDLLYIIRYHDTIVLLCLQKHSFQRSKKTRMQTSDESTNMSSFNDSGGEDGGDICNIFDFVLSTTTMAAAPEEAGGQEDVTTAAAMDEAQFLAGGKMPRAKPHAPAPPPAARPAKKPYDRSGCRSHHRQTGRRIATRRVFAAGDEARQRLRSQAVPGSGGRIDPEVGLRRFPQVGQRTSPDVSRETSGPTYLPPSSPTRSA